MNAVDPSGLRPLTDEELKSYDKSAGSHWEYFVAGAVVVVGVALLFTGVGGPVGLALIGAASGALISGGVSVGLQKYQDGVVNWGRVGKDAAIGGAAGLVGGVAAGLMAKAAPSVVQAGTGVAARVSRAALSSTGRGASAAGGSGATSNVLNYGFNYEGEKTVMGFVGSAVTGAGTGVLFGVAGSKASRFFNANLPITPVYRSGAGAHRLAHNISPWTTGVNESVNRLSGGRPGLC